MQQREETHDIVVCGGGLAGFCAAVAAARAGAKTCLVHNRPVLGGNSSSEIGVTPHGAAAFHAYARETGILSEALIAERAANHAEIYENGWTNSVWDLVLYDLAKSTPGLTLHLNTDVLGVEKREARQVSAVLARVQNAEVNLRLNGRLFIDCTGDGLVADAAGCTSRMGSEGREEFQEPHAPAKASGDTMGNSIHFLARDVGRPVPYAAPAWAMRYEDAGFFYQQGRIPKEPRGGFWWIEIGVPFDTIHDNETIRHELTRHALGVWDWMKNRDPRLRERMANYALDWVGQVPGKRESRRILGRYLMTEHDVLQRTAFLDEIAFGGWFVDLHTPGGLLARSSEPSAAAGGHDAEYDTFSDYAAMSYCVPYGIPLRALLARDTDNLLMAGRNISVTHAALGTVRVMGTTALLGQAAGTAAALALERGLDLDRLAGEAAGEVQQRLLRGGCFLPNVSNRDSADLARLATVEATSSATVHGVAPETPGFHHGLAIWRDQPQYAMERAEVMRGQLIALDAGRIDCLELCLSNDSSEPRPARLRLSACEHIWDYRAEPGPALAVGEVMVPPGSRHWVRWPLAWKAATWNPGWWVRIDLLANASLSWHIGGRIIPGHMAMYQISPSRMRRFGNGHTLAYRITPGQQPFDAAQVISGVTRPHRATNLWVSDPAQPLPQSVSVRWPDPCQIASVELTFPGHLIREYHAYAPGYKDPQCACEYAIEVQATDGSWREVQRVTGNIQRHRIHRLDIPVQATALRVVIHATHGDPSAAIYEVRCYGPV